MSSTCQIASILDLGCAEFWVQRYQGLLVGAVALTIAFTQMTISRRLAAITIAQENRRMAEQNTKVALATIYVDKVLTAAALMSFQLICAAEHQQTGETKEGEPVFRWDHPLRMAARIAPGAPEFELSKFEDAAAQAFPKDAARLLQLALTVKAIASASEDTSALNDTLADLFVYSNALHHLKPEIRLNARAV